MENNYHISANQLAEFAVSTKKGKARILHQQVVPNKVLIPWYQSAKGSIKRYFKNVTDHKPLKEGIKKIQEKRPKNKRQLSDKTISLEVLKKMSDMHLEKYFVGITYEVVRPITKTLSIKQVDIGISPEVIFKFTHKGQVCYGAIKIHISKNKPFSLNQCQQVSALLKKYLKTKIIKRSENVVPSVCLCIDIFANRVVCALEDDIKTINDIESLCNEIKSEWPRQTE